MSWDFRQQLRNLTASAGRGLSRVRQRSFLEALAAAYSLMVHAGANGEPADSRNRLQAFVENSDVLAGYSVADLDGLLAQHRQEADFEVHSATREWLKRVARLGDQSDTARLLVRVVMAVVGGADALNHAQRQVVEELCTALGLQVGDFLPVEMPAGSSLPARSPTPAEPSPARLLQAGERLPLSAIGARPSEVLHLRLDWDNTAKVDVDPTAFLLDQQGKTRTDADMVFYNQPRDTSGGVVLLPGPQVGFELRLSCLADTVQRLAFTLTLAGDGDFPALGEICLELATAGGQCLRFVLRAGSHGETAMVIGELYRRDTDWRFAAVGQGYRGGLAAMCEQFGITVAD